ncbi:MAG: hypothetical protein FP816_13900 [Desulfobacteraceae bacterium]|nr:hypothetical protein [Desulfobacteraceae bacterium]MBU4002033.1 hypothetical protein [Pseudomonadota bacterium]MBU4055211.1 hypothetical protein [Pseudomonadota bacterium]
MKRYGAVILMMAMGILFSGAAYASEKILVIPGVSEATATSMETYQDCIKGITETLGTKGLVPEFLYVDLDDAPDDMVREQLGKSTAQKVKEMAPKVVMVLNDNAVKYIGLNITEVPVVFAFVFGAPETLGLPKTNITGVARRSYAVDNWKMAKDLTGAKTVALLSKAGFSMAGVKQVLSAQAAGLEKLSGVKYMDMFLCETFDEWQNHVKNWPAEMIYLADTSRLKQGDKEISRAEVVIWTVANSMVPVIASNEEDTENGALFSVVTSTKHWGIQATEMTLKILAGTPVEQIPMETVNKGALLVNAKTAAKMGVEIPYEILSTADAVFE